jgi:hypothetical protein
MDPDTGDWRYENVKWVQGGTFRFLQYRAPSREWDHDHCFGCWAKFAEYEGPDILREGFAYAEPFEVGEEPECVTQRKEEVMRCLSKPALDDVKLHWLCSECFEDFREPLNFGLM